MSALPPTDAAKFGKIIGLLASDQHGERANAALKATEFLRAHEMGWGNVADAMIAVPAVRVDPPRAPATPRRASRRDRCRPAGNQGRAHQSRAYMLLHCGADWNDWSKKFLASIVGWSGRLSDKQSATLAGMEDEAKAWLGGRKS